MLGFKQFLLENRINWLKKNVTDIDTSHDHLARHKDPEKVIDHFAEHDPTRKKLYTQWMVNQYKKQNVRQEDAPQLHGTLKDFEKHKSKLEKRDINQYKHPSELVDAIEPHKDSEPEISKRQQTKQIKHEGADLIHHDGPNNVTVHHLKTADAAKHYGKGTQWCTAGDRGNSFDEYNEHGPLLLVQHGGRKYQMHSKGDQLADERDVMMKMHHLHPDIQKSLAKSDHPEIKKANLIFENPHYKPSDSDAENIINSGDGAARMKLANHPEHAGKLVNDEHIEVRMNVAKHPEHAGKLVRDRSFPVRENVAEHPEHAGKLVKDRDPRVRETVAQHSEHAGKLINDPNVYVRAQVARHPEHAHNLINDPGHNVRRNVASHSHLAHHFVNDESHSVRGNAARANPDVAGRLIHDEDPTVRAAVAEHPEHAGKMLNDDSSMVRFRAAEHPEHAKKLLDDAHPQVQGRAKFTLTF